MATGEGPSSAAGGILGVNALQHAVDGFDRGVGQLRDIVSRLGEAAKHYQAGRSTAGSWNRMSNWSGSGNGGNYTFSTPGSRAGSSGSGSGDSGSGGTGGSHRAEGPAQFGGGDSGLNATHRAQVSGWSRFNRAAGMAGMGYSAMQYASAGYQAITEPKSQAIPSSQLMLTMAEQSSMGQNVNATQMMSNSWGSMNAKDAAGARYTAAMNSGYVVGSAGYRRYMNSVKAMTLANPMESAQKATDTLGKFYTPQGYNTLRTVGISTIGSHGSRKSITQIANQILDQVDPQHAINDPQSVAAALSPTSPMMQTLGNWVATGVISGSQEGEVVNQIQMILKARQSNINAKQLQHLIATRTSSNRSNQILKHAHIGNTVMQHMKDLHSEQRQANVNELGSFNKGLRDATAGLEAAAQAAAAFAGTPLGSLQGRIRGVSSQGKAGTVLGIGHGFITGGGAAGKGYHNGGFNPVMMGMGFSEPGKGGSNETRMSVAKGGVSVGASSAPHTAGSVGFGGPGPGKSAGGSGHGGTHLGWPTKAHGPITAGFGQAGSHWSSGFHTGIDIGVGTGTPVHAAGPGTVSYAGWNSAYGNLVKINHSHGVTTLYGHNSRLVVHDGARVRKGQLIAYSGATGNATGPHVHFEVDVNGRPVDPMRYLRGGATIKSSGTSKGSAGSTGSGTTSTIGAGTSMTTGGVGMNEVDVLEAALSSSGGSSVGAFAGAGGNAGEGHGSGHSAGQHFSGGGTPSANIRLGKRMAAAKGWTGLQWQDLKKLWTKESGWNDHAKNPSSGAYGIPQALPASKIPGGYHSTAVEQINWGLQYIAQRYGNPANAWAHETRMNWYDKGAWNLQQDEVAKVHKGEMIVPKKEADQIREILVNGNPYRAMGNQAGRSEGPKLEFHSGAVQVHVHGGGNGAQDGRAIGKGFVDTLLQDERITSLQHGKVVNHP